MTFTPNGAGYDFSGPTRFEKLFSGIVAPRPTWLVDGDVRRTEHIGPEDTFDGDYGRLLDRANYGKTLASPAGTDRRWKVRGDTRDAA